MRLGFIRIEKWVRLCFGFNRIYSVWCRIHSEWNLKRIQKDWKIFPDEARIHSDWKVSSALFRVQSDLFGLMPDSFGLKFEKDSKGLKIILLRMQSDWNLKRLTSWKGLKRIKKYFRMRLGFIRIEKWVRLCFRFNRIYSVWCRIHSDWNLKRLMGWKGFKRIKKYFRMRLGFIQIEKWVRVCFGLNQIYSVWCRIHSDWNLKRLIGWKGFKRI